MNENHRPQPRGIRSFVRREGRMTRAQNRAWAELWPRYGLELGEAPLDLDQVFGRRAPRTLEIGFGNGESLVAMAAARPDEDFVGVEVHRPGVGHLCLAIAERELANIRVICHDAVAVLEQLPADSLDRVLLLFPDPWPKQRHHKRRIVQPPFISAVARVLRPGGQLHMATDWQPYAEHMLEVVGRCPEFENTAGPGALAQRPHYRLLTRFEKRGLRLGHGVADLVFTYRPRPPAR